VGLVSVSAKTMSLAIFNKNAAKNYLLHSLSGLPGISQKIFQQLSMRLDHNDCVPLEPLSVEKIRSEIERSHPKLFAQIRSLDEVGKIASIGQVHRAVLNDGREVAIKVKLPNIDQEIWENFRLIRKAAPFAPGKKYGMQIHSFLDSLENVLREELDYQLEAKNQHEFRRCLAKFPQFVVPEVIDSLSNDCILTQAFELSVSPSEVKYRWQAAEKRYCAELLFTFGVQSLFNQHLLHGDFHAGNFGFRKKNTASTAEIQMVLYDFGAVLRLEKSAPGILICLIDAYGSGRHVSPFNALCSIGFDPEKLKHIAACLPALCETIFEPFLTDLPWRPGDWDLQLRIDRLLGENKWWFRSAGPPWFLQLMRSMAGVLFSMKDMDAAVFSRKILLTHLDASVDYSSVRIEDYSKYLENQPNYNCTNSAKNLTVLVTENTEEVVSLSMPARAVDDLEELIPGDKVEKIKAGGIDFEEIKVKAQRSGYMPQTLFEAQVDIRRYLVRLV